MSLGHAPISSDATDDGLTEQLNVPGAGVGVGVGAGVGVGVGGIGVGVGVGVGVGHSSQIDVHRPLLSSHATYSLPVQLLGQVAESVSQCVDRSTVVVLSGLLYVVSLQLISSLQVSDEMQLLGTVPQGSVHQEKYGLPF